MPKKGKEVEETKRLLTALFFMSFLLAVGYSEGTLSIELKSMSPGIAGEKSAEMIFDVINTDFTLKMEGFLWCQTPSDTAISSTLGAGAGFGAQYLSPKFVMDKGPSQKGISLTLQTAKAGTYDSRCFIKYIPFKETEGVKEYLKMNQEYISEAELVDGDYRLLRLDNLFTTEEAKVNIFENINLENPWVLIGGIILLLVIVVAFFAGKSSK